MDDLMDDDYDPLAPVHYGDVDVEDAQVGADGGHADPDNVVRVWLTDGRLTRVQVSPVWHLKLRDKSLDDCFAAALAGANLGVAAAVDLEEADLTGVDPTGLPPLGREALAGFRRALANLRLRWEEAVERRQDALGQGAAPLEVEHDGVTVRLDAGGRAVAVAVDDELLEEYGTKEINQAVLQAAQRAYAAYRSAAPPDDELAALARDHEILMAGLTSMLSGRNDR